MLLPGTRLGPYEVTTQLGAGGMGEVYRATDTNLKRQVAIKVLPDGVAADPEFYIDRTGRLMTVSVDSRAAAFTAGIAQSILEPGYYTGSGTVLWSRTYDVAPDGKRFLMIKSASRAEPTMMLVRNWIEELKRLVRPTEWRGQSGRRQRVTFDRASQRGVWMETARPSASHRCSELDPGAAATGAHALSVRRR